jgi:hypothetical protein
MTKKTYQKPALAKAAVLLSRITALSAEQVEPAS